ncbi:putative HhH-GPD family protein [Bradyrhizobium ottawaense]
MQIRLINYAPAGEFEWLWPSRTVEKFHRSWRGRVAIDGAIFEFRHAVGHRHVYGKDRVHSVTWLGAAPVVEGVEADDYRTSRGLLSVIRRDDKKHARTDADVAKEYEEFLIVGCRDEINASHSPRSLAIKIAEDNVAAWATHAAIRAVLVKRVTPVRSAERTTKPPETALPQSGIGEADPTKTVDALLTFGRSQARPPSEPKFAPTPDACANEFLRSNALAFLYAVIADQGMPAERAWYLPYGLNRRLGHLDPSRIVADQVAVEAAVRGPPSLHRFPRKYTEWVVAGARRLLDQYGGDAARIWTGRPTAREVYERLDQFEGIGQKKAAMAVEILERDLGVPITAMEGSDVAYDVHVRRVFLRTGLAQRDELDHIISVARTLDPGRPGEIDMPTWRVGRQWCHAGTPDCGACPLDAVCPKIISRSPLRWQP